MGNVFLCLYNTNCILYFVFLFGRPTLSHLKPFNSSLTTFFFPAKSAPQCQSRPLILFVRQSSLARQCVSKYVSSLSLSNELHRKSCGRFVIFCRKMINARHSCGICQTLKNPTLPLKRTPWSTKIIHSHIWSPPPFPSRIFKAYINVGQQRPPKRWNLPNCKQSPCGTDVRSSRNLSCLMKPHYLLHLT